MTYGGSPYGSVAYASNILAEVVISNVFSDGIGVGEVFIARKDRSKIFNESLGISEVFDTTKERMADFDESLSIGETVTKDRSKTFNEDLIIGEVLNENKARAKEFNESLSAGELFSVLRAVSQTINEPIYIIESTRRRLNGVIIDIWSKEAKTTSIWTKVPKDID